MVIGCSCCNQPISKQLHVRCSASAFTGPPVARVVRDYIHVIAPCVFSRDSLLDRLSASVSEQGACVVEVDKHAQKLYGTFRVLLSVETYERVGRAFREKQVAYCGPWCCAMWRWLTGDVMMMNISGIAARGGGVGHHGGLFWLKTSF